MWKPYALRWARSYLLRQQSASPVLFFLLFALRHIYSQQHYHIELQLLALFLAVFRSYNLLYLLPSFIYVDNDLISALCFFSSVLSCNRKWKVYLFLFVAADSYFSSSSSSPQFIAIASISMCVAIYNNLIFQTNKDNLRYFIGFFSLSALQMADLIASRLQIDSKAASLVFITFLAGYLSKMLLQVRFGQIRQLDLEHIKNPRIMARYIDFLLQDFKVSPLLEAKLEIHAKNCMIPHCYCKSSKFKHDSQFYLRQMFQNFMKKLGSLGDQHLWEYYIQFYLKKDQVLIAYYYIVKWKPTSYFSMVSKVRCEAMVIDFLEKENCVNPYEKEYVYGLSYDEKCIHLSTQIHEILKLKIQFWKEVAKECLSLQKLQDLGGEIVTRMYQLNKFYNQTIRQYEKYLFCFDSTILYGIYLISTTNFKDYAKSIIKSTSKLMEQVCVSQRNASETFAIRAVVKNSKLSHIRQSTRAFKAERDISTQIQLEQSYQNEFKLIIDAVSSGFCRMVNMPKQQMVGSQLNILIPNCYKDVHNARLSDILDFNSDKIKELSRSKVWHSELKLLFKGDSDELFSGLICIKYHMDIKQGVAFLSVIKKTPQKKCEALATFEGQLMQKQKGFPAQIIKHSEVRKYLRKMHQTWKLQRTITEEKFKLMVNRANYEVTISSPFAFLIQEKPCLINKVPPIHIQLLNEENNKLRSVTSFRANNKADYEIKKMELMINREQESSANSSKTANSAVNVISNFSENNSVPIYKYIIVTFLLLLLCNVALNLSFSLMPVLPWDNTVSYNNPIVDNTNLYLLEIVQTRAMLNLQDSINYRKYSNMLNDSRISSYFSGKPYPAEVVSLFTTISRQFKQIFTSLCNNYSTLLWPSIKERFDQSINVPNILKGIAYYPLTQTLTYRQTTFLFGMDTILVYNQMSYDGLLITSLYNSVQAQVSDLSVIPGIISSSFSGASTQQVVMGVIFMGLMILLVLPMWVVLRKRFKTHERVFDLLSSIESEDVMREIQILLYISNILNNYDESKEKLKLNVLDYQANSINPKHGRTRHRKPSVINELVMGLEKFDVMSNSADERRPNSSENVLMRTLKLSVGEEQQLAEIFSSIKSELFEDMSKQAQLKGRKRSGQLDLTGSEFDDKKCVGRSHCAVYLLLISFLPFMVNTLLINLDSIDYSQQAENDIKSAYSDILKFNKRLYQTKVYLWEGPNALKTTFNASSALSILQPILTKLIHFDTITNTETNFVPPATYGTAKLSQYLTSLRLIESQLTSTMKNLAQMRYKLQGGNGNLQMGEQASRNLFQKIFYLQSLSNQREVIIQDMAKDIQQDMFQYMVGAVQRKEITLLILLIWSAVSFANGLVLTIGMKQQFFKEVYILTFLNDEMLLKNKRIESYLDSLAKNTYF